MSKPQDEIAKRLCRPAVFDAKFCNHLHKTGAKKCAERIDEHILYGWPSADHKRLVEFICCCKSSAEKNGDEK